MDGYLEIVTLRIDSACHKRAASGVMYRVNGASDVVAGLESGADCFDLEAVFRAQYQRIARVIAAVVHDRARAEDLAVEVFLKLWWHKKAQQENTDAWLYRSAVRIALDELRRRGRRARYERLLGCIRPPASPDEIHAASEQQVRVWAVLSRIAPRHAELLLLRCDGLSYRELAAALDLNPVSIGTLLSRAQQAFRKEYVKRYGKEF